MNELLEVIGILRDWLRKNGYDGLVCPDAECGCELDDLACCDDMMLHCHPAYKGKRGYSEGYGGHVDYLMFANKEARDKHNEEVEDK